MTFDDQAAPRPPAVDAPVDREGGDQEGGDREGGESACWLDRVCPDCGRLADAPPPTDCPRCGTRIGD